MRAHRLPLLLTWMLACTLPATAATLRIDSTRSHAEFGVRLLWFRQITGRFEQLAGTITVAPHADTAVVEAWIDVASVHMEQARYERWLLAPEFFDAAHHPRIHFISTAVPLAALDRGGPLTGRLTMRGRTHEVSFHMLPSDCPQPGHSACTIKVRGLLDRSDFDMSGHRVALSDRVELGLVVTLEPLR